MSCGFTAVGAVNPKLVFLDTTDRSLPVRFHNPEGDTQKFCFRNCGSTVFIRVSGIHGSQFAEECCPIAELSSSSVKPCFHTETSFSCIFSFFSLKNKELITRLLTLLTRTEKYKPKSPNFCQCQQDTSTSCRFLTVSIWLGYSKCGRIGIASADFLSQSASPGRPPPVASWDHNGTFLSRTWFC